MDITVWRRGQKRVRADYSYGAPTSYPSKRVRLATRGPLRAPLRTGGFYGASRYRRLGPRIRRLLRYWSPPERKFLDVTALGTTLANIRFILMNGIAQGTGVSGRIGNKITMTSAQGRISIYVSTATTSPSVRCMLVFDSQTNSAVFTGGDLLASAAAGVDFLSPLNLNNRERFRILWDRTYTVDTVSTERATFNFYKKMKLPVVYDGTGALVDDIQTGSLYLVIMSSDRTTPPIFDYYTRVRYIDN